MGDWVLANQPDTYWQTHDAPNQTNGGPTFRVYVNSGVSALRWWRDGPFRGTPTVIGLWRVTDQALIASVSPVVDNFTTGWQVSPLDPVPVIQPGLDYLVAAFFPSDGGLGTSGPFGPTYNTPPTGIVITSDARRYHDGAPYQFPNNSIVNYRQSLDAYIEFGDPPYPTYGQPSNADLQAALYSWLHPLGENFLGSGVDQTLQQAQTNSNKLDTLLGRVTQAFVDSLNLFIPNATAQQQAILDAINAQGNEFRDNFADVLDRIGDFTGVSVLGYAAEILRFVNGLNSKPYRDPVIYYDQVDQISFTDSLEWPVQADLYTVDLTAFDPAGTSEPFGTQTRYGYLAKWSVLDVDYAAEWHYFNTQHARLEVPHGTMPGLALILYRPGAGTVTAWKLKAEE